ncbi:MAG: hypothetical protein MZU79_02950 [Anaerotruncus sp.]|nr:hypothetical protein [Anaerotruncus sp.]
MSHWAKLGARTAGSDDYGIGLTRLRKMAKRVGRDRELALALWKTKVYEAKVISLLVDDPARITLDQAEKQVEQLAGGLLAHVFASCDATLAKTSFVVELADRWVEATTQCAASADTACSMRLRSFPARRRRMRVSSSRMSGASRTLSGRSRRECAWRWGRRRWGSESGALC